MGSLTVQWRRIGEAADIEPRWRALAEASGAGFFTGWDWASASERVSARNNFVAEISDGETLVGLARFVRTLDLRHGVMPVRQLRLNEAGLRARSAIQAEYNDIVAAPGMREAAWAALLDWRAHENAPEWDEIVIANAGPALETHLRGRGLFCHRFAEAGSAFVDLAALRAGGASNRDDYLATLSANTRRQIVRALRLYEGRGPLKIRRAKSLREAQAFLADIAHFHEEKWRARGRDGLGSAHALRRFHEALIARALPAGKVELARISAGADAFAWVYNFIDHGRVMFNIAGLRTEADNRLKPGLVAHTLLIEDHLRRGASAYDFLAGDDRYKLSLGQKGPDFIGFSLQRPTITLRTEQTLRRVKHVIAARRNEAA